MMKTFKLNRIISIEQLNLPYQYKLVLSDFIHKIRKYFCDKLLLLVVTGSGGKSKIIEGWSDLDFLIVLKYFSLKDNSEIARLVNISPIKIGTTIYSKQEFESGLVDSKTVFNLELIRKKIIIPIILQNNLEFPYFTNTDRKKLHIILLPNIIHELKRKLDYKNEHNLRPIAKSIDTIMKFIISISSKKLISGYKEVQDEFYKLFPSCPKVYNVFELLEKNDIETYCSQCWNFLSFITTKDIFNKHQISISVNTSNNPIPYQK